MKITGSKCNDGNKIPYFQEEEMPQVVYSTGHISMEFFEYRLNEVYKYF